MLDAVPDAVLDMPFQDHLAAAVQRGFGGVDLCQHILARHILVDHTVNRLHLPDDLFEAAVQIFRVHTLLHGAFLHTGVGMAVL